MSIRTIITILLVFITTVLFLSGCGGDAGDTATGTATETAASTSSEINSSPYARDIQGLADHADQINADYSRLVESYEAKEATKEEVINRAVEGAAEFAVMVERLGAMEVPEGLEEANQQLVSGFGKWKAFYDLQVQGLSANDTALLAQARELDSQAVSEVKGAIEEINKAG